jgi:hypothetical protein
MKPPKEKAKEIIENICKNGFDIVTNPLNKIIVKQIALYLITEILKANPIIPLYAMLESEALDAAYEYWKKVEQEIINY